MPASAPSLPAWLTAPFAFLDRPLNAFYDASIRVAPWLSWPVSPPRRDETVPRLLYAQIAVQSVLLQIGVERLERSSAGPIDQHDVQRERAVAVLATVVLWSLAIGAWDRRAAELRAEPWSRLVARLTR